MTEIWHIHRRESTRPNNEQTENIIRHKLNTIYVYWTFFYFIKTSNNTQLTMETYQMQSFFSPYYFLSIFMLLSWTVTTWIAKNQIKNGHRSINKKSKNFFWWTFVSIGILNLYLVFRQIATVTRDAPTVNVVHIVFLMPY